jgi:hypothetical protein
VANETLLAAIERHETLADSYGSLSEDRAEALDRYLGKPYGNEIEGRSAVVSRDVWDTVEWIKPQIADVFCGGEQVVAFSPTGPQDVKAAEQETEVVNHIVTEKNEWFTLFGGWQHDALLQKVGYVLAYWDEKEDRTVEQYKCLSADELAMILSDSSVSVTEAEIEEGPYGREYSIKLQRVKNYGCVRIENVAPEKVLVSHNARNLSLQDPRLDFVEYIEHKTISELRDEGFKVEDDLSDHASTTQDWADNERDEANPFRNQEDGESSPASRRLKVRNVWIRHDSDDDGRTELRRVVVVGTTILLDEDADQVTLVALCPIMLPHQHSGQSVADAVMDLEKIKTALLRGALDNVYLANNGRHAINVKNVNLDDMLVSRPGGVVRVDGVPGENILPLQHSTTGQVAIPMLEYVDRIAQKRTGVSEAMQGLNPNALNNSMGAQTNMAMVTAAQQRIKFIARTFAETGVKSLYRIVHALTSKHAKQPMTLQLREQWVAVDPREWVKREDFSISIDNGDRGTAVAMLEKVMMAQMQAMAAGLTSPPKMFNALKRWTQKMGYRDPLEFWDDPATKPPAPPQPPIELLKVQAQGQQQAQIEQMRLQAEAQLKAREHDLKMREIEANLALQQSNDIRDSQREQMKAEVQAMLERERIQLDQWKAQLEAAVTQQTTEQNNATKLQIAGIQQEAQAQSEVLRIGHEATQKHEDRAHQLMQSEKQAQQQDKQAKQEAEVSNPEPDPRVEQLIEMMRQMQEEMNAPAEIVRDALGKAVGVKRGSRTREVVRDESGRAIGLA